MAKFMWEGIIPRFVRKGPLFHIIHICHPSHQVRDLKMHSVIALDSRELAINMHSRGINVRYLGRIVALLLKQSDVDEADAPKGTTDDVIKAEKKGEANKVAPIVDALVHDMVVRAMKHVIRDEVLAEVPLMSQATVVARCLSLLFGGLFDVAASKGTTPKAAAAPQGQKNTSQQQQQQQQQQAQEAAKTEEQQHAQKSKKKGKGASSSASSSSSSSTSSSSTRPNVKLSSQVEALLASREALWAAVVADVRASYRFTLEGTPYAERRTAIKRPFAALRYICQTVRKKDALLFIGLTIRVG